MRKINIIIITLYQYQYILNYAIIDTSNFTEDAGLIGDALQEICAAEIGQIFACLTGLRKSRLLWMPNFGGNFRRPFPEILTFINADFCKRSTSNLSGVIGKIVCVDDSKFFSSETAPLSIRVYELFVNFGLHSSAKLPHIRGLQFLSRNERVVFNEIVDAYNLIATTVCTCISFPLFMHILNFFFYFLIHFKRDICIKKAEIIITIYY